MRISDWSSDVCSSDLPDLCKERPGVARLVREVEDVVGDRRRRNEEVVGLVGQAFALPGQVDYRIDNEIGDMHALGPKIARQRFRQDALRGLGRREARETRLAAQGGGVAGDEDRTSTRLSYRH